MAGETGQTLPIMPKKSRVPIFLQAAFVAPVAFAHGQNGTGITITPANSCRAVYGEPATIAGCNPFRQVCRVPTPIFLGRNTLAAASAMRCEWEQTVSGAFGYRFRESDYAR
jgi:hypothetical protein